MNKIYNKRKSYINEWKRNDMIILKSIIKEKYNMEIEYTENNRRRFTYTMKKQ